MTILLPDPVYAYSARESDNLKEPLTPLPVAFSAADGFGPEVATPGAPAAPVTPKAEPGDEVRSQFDDWYYRIHLLPAVLPLGNLAGDMQRVVTVWNAFFNSVSLQDFTLTPGQGLSYASEISPPALIPALEDVAYNILVSGNGAPTITGEAVWTIDGVEYVVEITGQRSVLFGFRPHWKMQRVNETYEWLNTLTQTYSGYEQVMSIRAEPRRVLDYRFRLHERDARMFDEATFGWTGRVFGLPWWPERSTLTAAAPLGAETIYLDTTGRSFTAGGQAVLHKSASEYEMLDIAEVHDDRLVLNNALALAWLPGSHVYPVLPSIPGAEFVTSRAASNNIDGAARFVVTPSEAVVNLPIEPAPFEYRGYEMYTGETNWRMPLGINITARRKEVDGNTGPLSIRRKADFPLVMRGFSWMLKNREVAREVLAFIARRQGRRYPAWMPSGMDDFKPIQDIPSGQNSVRVERSDHGRLIGLNEARRDVVLILRSGARIAKRILAVEDDGPDSVITFTDAFDAPIPLSDLKRISYLGLYRLASDTVTVAWATTEVAEIDVNLILKKDRDS